MQTILGAGGGIGQGLAAELITYGTDIRLVSRNPRKVNSADELIPADLTNADQVDRAVAGSSIVYLTAGLEYKTKVWQSQWPVIMRNVTRSCIRHGARLVFFDNVYMYDRDFLGNMTEDTPIRPTSRKGEVRAEIEAMLRKEMETGRLEALIARSADFIGPLNSVLVEMVYRNLKKGKKANWFSRADKVHSFTHTLDAARGTAMLGNTPEAYGQVWHLPTAADQITGNDWVSLFAREMKADSGVRPIPDFMLGMLGLFIPVMKELNEMAYQYDRDYYFNSSKFNSHFGYIPLTPGEGVKMLVGQLRQGEKA